MKRWKSALLKTGSSILNEETGHYNPVNKLKKFFLSNANGMTSHLHNIGHMATFQRPFFVFLNHSADGFLNKIEISK